MQKKTIKIEGMTCGHCSARVEKALSALEGVDEVKVNLKKGEAYVTGQDLEETTMIAKVEDAGYKALSVQDKKAKNRLFGR